MKIQVVGTGCRRCGELYDAVAAAVEKSGQAAELSKVESLEEMLALGITFTPALVIDGAVKVAGKVPTSSEITAWLREAADRG